MGWVIQIEYLWGYQGLQPVQYGVGFDPNLVLCSLCNLRIVVPNDGVAVVRPDQTVAFTHHEHTHEFIYQEVPQGGFSILSMSLILAMIVQKII